MPEHLRALVVVLVLSSTAFALAKTPACAVACRAADFERRRNLWFAITLAAFLAHNFWVFIVIAAALLLYSLPREPNKLALYLFLLFAVPAMPAQITGLGLIQHFFSIDYVRLLALAVLLPAFLSLRGQPEVQRFGRSLPDKLIASYLVLLFILQLPHQSLTETLRSRVFYAFIDVFLPYYVASRSLKNLAGFRDAFMSFAVAALVLSAIGVFEFAKRWLLYLPLEDALGVAWEYGSYLSRGDGLLRAQGSTGHAIALGYVMAVATGFFFYLRNSLANPMIWRFGLVLLIAGLIAPMSRGPWLGAAVMVLVFTATGPAALKRLAATGLLGMAMLPIVLASPAGKEILAFLPFVGTVETGNITYRQRIAEVSIDVILQNPFFGAFDFMHLPVMQQLKQGQGIVDIVNTYVGVALETGLVGLSLFVGFFVAVAAGIFSSMRSLPDRDDERYLLGRALLSTLLGILTIICTASSITVIPVIYWCVAGLGVAYARMLALGRIPQPAGCGPFEPAAMRFRT